MALTFLLFYDLQSSKNRHITGLLLFSGEAIKLIVPQENQKWMTLIQKQIIYNIYNIIDNYKYVDQWIISCSADWPGRVFVNLTIFLQTYLVSMLKEKEWAQSGQLDMLTPVHDRRLTVRRGLFTAWLSRAGILIVCWQNISSRAVTAGPHGNKTGLLSVWIAGLLLQ